MIPRRYAWLMRDTQTMADADLGRGHACRICRVTERGETRLRAADLNAHLAAHRREKLTDTDGEAQAIAAATRGETL